MDDPRRYLGLHTVGMLRELLRKWWQVDIGFADASGQLLDQTWGNLPPSGNDFCRALLSTPKGLRRCLSSVREIHRRLCHEQGNRSPVVHSCHLGLQMAAASVYGSDRYRGFVFACGFSSRELSRTRVARLRGTIHEIFSQRASLDGERVPVLSREDTERLRDLLEYGAREIAAFEQEFSRREPAEVEAAEASFEGIVGRSPAMAEVVGRLKRLAKLSSPILLVGENGTGKRLLARAVHLSGPRRRGPFVVFEGAGEASSVEALAVEVRLFGQVRGGSLGKIGLLESTGGGTLYFSSGSWQLPSLQVKLLRLLQEGTLVPLGADRPVESDVRLIFSLEGNFHTEVSEGRLRHDLAGWLEPQLLKIPSLGERKEDLASLAEAFIRRQVPEGRPLPALHPECLALFQRYHWPGNASELEEEIRSLLSLSPKGGPLGPEGVSARIRQSTGQGSPALVKALGETKDLKQAIEILERELIHEGLVRTHWNKSLLARQLGVSRSNLLAKLEKYGLERPRSKEA